jgi:hypothetical protein
VEALQSGGMQKESQVGVDQQTTFLQVTTTSFTYLPSWLSGGINSVSPSFGAIVGLVPFGGDIG